MGVELLDTRPRARLLPLASPVGSTVGADSEIPAGCYLVIHTITGDRPFAREIALRGTGEVVSCSLHERFLARLADVERVDTGWAEEYARTKQAEIEAQDKRAALALRGAGAIGYVPEDSGPS